MPTLTRSVLVLILTYFSLLGFGQNSDTTILFQSLVLQFESDRYTIDESFQIKLDLILQQTDTLDGVYAVIQAHTDDVGDADYNLKLSQKRAEAIQNYLVNHGFPSQVVQVDYFGEQQLLDNNLNKKGRALNRRAVLRIYYLKEQVDPVPDFVAVVFHGRTIDSRSGEGVESKIVISGKNFKVEAIADSLGHFIAEVPENAILKFQAYPKSPAYKPRMLMTKSTQDQLSNGIIIEMNGQELLQPKNIRTLSGVITNEYDQPLANAMLKIQGKTINDSLYTDDKGRFEFNIPERETVRLSAYLKDYFYAQKLVSPISNQDSFEVKLELPKLEEGRRYVAGDILFVGNRDVVLPTSIINLQSLKEVVRLADDYCFKIEGHINLPGMGRVGRSSTNFKLSQDRAIRIYKFLRSNGIEDERICYEGFGNWNMLYPKAVDAREQMLNRRVEVLVIPCGN